MPDKVQAWQQVNDIALAQEMNKTNKTKKRNKTNNNKQTKQ
jgi:hypothetical protein